MQSFKEIRKFRVTEVSLLVDQAREEVALITQLIATHLHIRMHICKITAWAYGCKAGKHLFSASSDSANEQAARTRVHASQQVRDLNEEPGFRNFPIYFAPFRATSSPDYSRF